MLVVAAMHLHGALSILLAFPLLACARPAERAPHCPPTVVAAEPGQATENPRPTPAPASTRLVPLDLPKASDFAAPPPVYDPSWTGEVHRTLMVTIAKDAKTYVDGQEVADVAEILKKADAAKSSDPEVRVVIMADRDVPWGQVVLTLDALKRSGITRIAFAIEAERKP